MAEDLSAFGSSKNAPPEQTMACYVPSHRVAKTEALLAQFIQWAVGWPVVKVLQIKSSSYFRPISVRPETPLDQQAMTSVSPRVVYCLALISL